MSKLLEQGDTGWMILPFPGSEWWRLLKDLEGQDPVLKSVLIIQRNDNPGKSDNGQPIDPYYRWIFRGEPGCSIERLPIPAIFATPQEAVSNAVSFMSKIVGYAEAFSQKCVHLLEQEKA